MRALSEHGAQRMVNMPKFDITMEHTEDSLRALSHMQYDLFCTRNYIARNLLSLAAIVVGAIYFTHFWGILLVAYGAYLMTSTYSSSNYTVKKLITAINASGKGFPSSRYCFTDKGIDITYHPTEAAKIIFDYKIYDTATEELMAHGRSVQVFMDKDYHLVWTNPEFYQEWKRMWGVEVF